MLFYISLWNYRNVKEKERGGRRREKDEYSDVSPSHSYSVQIQPGRAEPAYHCCWRLTWSHTHQHQHTKTLLHTHHPHKRRCRNSDRALGDATGWQPLSKSTLPPRLNSSFLSLSVFCRDCLFCSPSKFIYLSHSPLVALKTASVFSDWETFQTFLSVCRAHALLLSLPALFFLFSACERRQKSRTYLHVGARPDSDK